jgi:dihydroneopterin aldolase
VSDKLILKGVVFYGHHGVTSQERELGQPFVVDLEMELDLKVAGTSDDLSDTVNYVHVYKTVREIMEGPARNLLENLAEAVAQRVLGSFSMDGVLVRITKPHVPIKGAVLEGSVVEIYRRRNP